MFVAQLMTLKPMLDKSDLGNVCHEHLEYYSYRSLVKLYEQNGLQINNIKFNDIQGGSYQIYAGHYHSGSIDHYEDTKQQLADFVSTVEHNGKLLRSVLKDKRSQGLKCYVFGASTKGNTMLQIWQLADLFEGAAEIHSGKIGRYTVGTNIPIVEEQLALEHADVLFVPNFGFKDLFIEKLESWIRSGGQLVFAMPTVEVIDESSLTMHT